MVLCLVVGLKSGVKLRPMQLRAQLHQRVLGLRQRGFRYNQIIRRVEGEFGNRLSKSRVSGWVSGSHHPCGSVRKLDTTSRPELTYVIGVIMGDASMSISHYNYMIKLRVTDKEFEEEFARCLSVILGRPAPRVWWHEKTRAWHTELSSLLLRQFLLQPLSKLARTIQHCDACKGAFLRGFFDSEGSSSGHNISGYNTNLPLLQYVIFLLGSHFGTRTSGPYKSGLPPGSRVVIKGKSYHVNKQCYRILVRHEDNPKFANAVGFTMARKQYGILLN